MRHYCDLKGGIGGLHSFCGACVCLITLRLSPLYLFFYEEKRLVFLSQNTKSFRSHWPTLKTSRDINSNETRKKNDINRRIFSVRITRARLVSFYSLLCTSRERQRRSILAFSLVFLFVLGKMLHWRRRISISKDVKHNARLYYDRDSIHTYIREKETDDLRVITTVITKECLEIIPTIRTRRWCAAHNLDWCCVACVRPASLPTRPACASSASKREWILPRGYKSSVR